MDRPELYDEIASLYHLIYEDWEVSISRQATELDSLFREFLGPGERSILDVSCGIGTQALGLAKLGHQVTASDISPASVRRAETEARCRGLKIEFSIADMRQCHRHHRQTYDVVLSADNSVTHLLDDKEILKAFGEFFHCTRPGGITAVTVRDYEQEDRTPLQLRPYGIRSTDEGRFIVFQCWDFQEPHYDLTLYFLHENRDGRRQVVAGRSRYYAVGTGRLLELLGEAGFIEARRIDGRFFQPVLLARKPTT